jgi:protein PhnA
LAHQNGAIQPNKHRPFSAWNCKLESGESMVSAANPMSDTVCPMCEMNTILTHSDSLECLTCGHEWAPEALPDAAVAERVVKDAYGNVLVAGDVVAMIKDLKLKGTSQVLKVGTKSKPIRLVDGDHEISCKMDGLDIGLKACFVKKVL